MKLLIDFLFFFAVLALALQFGLLGMSIITTWKRSREVKNRLSRLKKASPKLKPELLYVKSEQKFSARNGSVSHPISPLYKVN